MSSTAQLLKKYGLRAKKSWGQNFLTDSRIVDRIVEATGAGADDWVIEIGAGLGALTTRLAERAGRVLAVERDRDLAAVLRTELGTQGRIEVVEANALTFDYRETSARAGRRPIVVGNLPYQIASPILFRLLDERQAIARIVIMLQKELGERLVAEPGAASYGAASVLVQAVSAPRVVCRVSRGAFVPSPQVDSLVLALEPLAVPRAADLERFAAVVHAAFGRRRKTLRNALGTLASGAAIDRALAAIGIDGGRRGETLSVEEFARLTGALRGVERT